MNLTGLHLLLTYQCTYECDHCFVWGSPNQEDVMTLAQIRSILNQGEDLGTVTSIYFEGGEAFLYYPVLLAAVRESRARGFKVGIVTNAYWATGYEDALEALRPFAGLLADLSASVDDYHGSEGAHRRTGHLRRAAEALGIPVGEIAVSNPGDVSDEAATLMYKGRAAAVLAEMVPGKPWNVYDECPYENLRDPGRVHVDPVGEVHLCQGISLGNLFKTPLIELVARYLPDEHPVVGPLLEGGPAELARRYDFPVDAAYADACHLCYTVRLGLRKLFPQILAPDPVYGV